MDRGIVKIVTVRDVGISDSIICPDANYLRISFTRRNPERTADFRDEWITLCITPTKRSTISGSCPLIPGRMLRATVRARADDKSGPNAIFRIGEFRRNREKSPGTYFDVLFKKKKKQQQRNGHLQARVHTARRNLILLLWLFFCFLLRTHFPFIQRPLITAEYAMNDKSLWTKYDSERCSFNTSFFARF